MPQQHVVGEIVFRICQMCMTIQDLFLKYTLVISINNISTAYFEYLRKEKSISSHPYLSPSIDVGMKCLWWSSIFYRIIPKRNCLFPVTVQKEKEYVDNKRYFGFSFSKKCVFRACFMLIGSWKGGKNNYRVEFL